MDRIVASGDDWGNIMLESWFLSKKNVGKVGLIDWAQIVVLKAQGRPRGGLLFGLDKGGV